jgi:glutamate synthase domain-containing protein 2/glutamate synthase domain-containing protein 1/glutamate synthase domain-containing protein 3
MSASDPAYPLYDARFEHDACGVGFVADAGGRSRGRVLSLALDGLGNLGHRGAFAADGESSDGAGIALPLEPAMLRHLGWTGSRPGVLMLFLPQDTGRRRRATALVDGALAAEGLRIAAWREVPVDPDALGVQARGCMPAVVQAFVQRNGLSSRPFERRLLLARRRMEMAAHDDGDADFGVPSASSRTVVYKGLVSGGRIAAFFRDLATARQAGVALSHAVFHQRYATNTRPTWKLAQPFRLIAHNGEINTVRGNRDELRGRMADLGGAFGRRLVGLGPLVTPEGSDSLALDEALDLLVAAGRRLDTALLLAIPDAPAMRSGTAPEVDVFRRRCAGLLSPWDGPAALAFSDGRRVGAMLDRNGLRPAAVTVTHGGLVAVASEAGAVPIAAAETAERYRLGPGEMLVVDPGRGEIRRDREAKLAAVAALDGGAGRTIAAGSAGLPRTDAARVPFRDDPSAVAPLPATSRIRWLCGLDAERQRLDIRTMALEGHEPLWSMGDDTPTPALGRLDRPLVDHLRQSFAQVTNPAIDPERERIVMDLAVELGRRSPLLGSVPAGPRTLRLLSPFVADRAGLRAWFAAGTDKPATDRPGADHSAPSRRRRLRTLDATWDPAEDGSGLGNALERLARQALAAARRGVSLLELSDRAVLTRGRLPVPSALAAGAVHTALTGAGLRGRTDLLVDASDILDVHAAAMALACGAQAVVPWMAMELAAELAGSRGNEELGQADAIRNLLSAMEKGLRKVLARMGISAVSSYIGGQFFEVLELAPEVAARCFPAAPAWPGTVTFAGLAERQLRRFASASELPSGERLPDPGFARYRSDGEAHLYAPPVVKAVQHLAAAPNQDEPRTPEQALAAYRTELSRSAATVRDQLELRPAHASIPLREVEPALEITRRFVGAAMSLGALSPEAHQALTIGLRRIGAASNSGEGGEDPAWYVNGADGVRHDTAIKQVASARFGVTAAYLSRAEQLEVKIAQGSKPGEGGQLPARKVTPLIARLRRAQPGQALISPPPHHDIYSIEDLAQLIADLRAINPGARIGVKLVAAIGVGTIAAGVAKAGADYVQISGHAGGTGASPLSSIKHVGIPWELGLAEAHQVLLHNGLRDRISLRTDGGLQTGRDVLIAAALGAEEFGFGTAALVALGCDMARQCHLDTCPTGIATQREDLRAKFRGTPEDVERFFLAVAEDVRRELAHLGKRSVAQVIGDTGLLGAAESRPPTLSLERLLGAPTWPASIGRRADPRLARVEVPREPASPVEARLAEAYSRLPHVVPDPAIHGLEHADSRLEQHPFQALAAITTAERSFGAHISGQMERGIVRRPVHWTLEGSAGQSFGAFAGESVRLELVGQANDYVGKGLSGGVVVLRPEPELADRASELAIAGNTCLYGATAGRMHVIGRAGMRFAVRNSGATAVVEGVGAHGCEYMTGGTAAILGPAGSNLCAGMTGGRVYLWDPTGERVAVLDGSSVSAVRLSGLEDAGRRDAGERIREFRTLLEAHRDAGSVLALGLLARKAQLGAEVWLIEALPVTPPLAAPGTTGSEAAATSGRLAQLASLTGA